MSTVQNGEPGVRLAALYEGFYIRLLHAIAQEPEDDLMCRLYDLKSALDLWEQEQGIQWTIVWNMLDDAAADHTRRTDTAMKYTGAEIYALAQSLLSSLTQAMNRFDFAPPDRCVFFFGASVCF
jgi:hypothetical protein